MGVEHRLIDISEDRSGSGSMLFEKVLELIQLSIREIRNVHVQLHVHVAFLPGILVGHSLPLQHLNRPRLSDPLL